MIDHFPPHDVIPNLQAVMALGLIVPAPPVLLGLVVPSFETIVATAAVVVGAWKMIQKKLTEASDDDSDCRRSLRESREELRDCKRHARELGKSLDAEEQRRRAAETLADERRKRNEILERYLDDEGDRHPRDRGHDHDRP